MKRPAWEESPFELYVDWLMVSPNGDSGIYLRSFPQVQIWDPSNPREAANGADTVSIWLNGQQTVNEQVLDNFFDRRQPVLPKGQIELQTHGSEIRFRNIYIREIKGA